jgi:hypothetical protein
MLTVYTFGDSILDCAHHNEFGHTPAGLLVANDDLLFPEFAGRDLKARGPTQIEHHARDGATIRELPPQLDGLQVRAPALALLTVGGNDLLKGLALDPGPGIDAFVAALDDFLTRLLVRPVYVANVYDPTFGDNEAAFLAFDADVARANHDRVNAGIAEVVRRHGVLVDLYSHFLAAGTADWLTFMVEPGLIGASEVRRCFLRAIAPELAPAG